MRVRGVRPPTISWPDLDATRRRSRYSQLTKSSLRRDLPIEVLRKPGHNQFTMPQLNHISVEIEATFGSQFQEESAVAMLEKVVQSWTEFYRSKHSKNTIRFRIVNAASLVTMTEAASCELNGSGPGESNPSSG
jgi:hypothetical protein